MDSTDLDKKDQPEEDLLFDDSGQLKSGDGEVDTGFDTMDEPPEEAKKPSSVRLAHKIAAVILIVNSVIVALETFIWPEGSDGIGQSITGILVGIILGVMLLTESPKGLTWARVAVVFGALVYTLQAVVAGDPITAGFQIFFSTSLILLLFGSPGKGRIITSVVMASLYVLVASLGVAIEVVGDEPFNAAILEASYDVSELQNNTLTGSSSAYTLMFPESENWRGVSRRQVLEENPAADSWAMDTSHDIHVLVIVEELDVDVDTLTDVVISNGSELLETFNVVSRENTQTTSGLEGRVVVAQGTTDGSEIGYKYGIFASGGRAYQLICFTTKENYPKFQESFTAIISSFIPAPALPSTQESKIEIEDSGPAKTL